MNIVILTHFPLNEFPFHEWIDTHAHHVHLFIDREGLEHTHNFQLQQASRYASLRVYDDYLTNGSVEADVLALAATARIDVILSYGEDDVIRAARLREKLGLPGQSLASAYAFRDKVVMKEYVQRAGLSVPAFSRVTSATDLMAFCQDHDFPVFVKPVAASGSIYARKISNQAELNEFMATGMKSRIPYGEYVPDFIVEKFVEGRLYHVDGLVVAGRLICCAPSAYTNDGLALAANDTCPTVSSYLLSESSGLKGRLTDFVKAVMHALPCPDTFAFHAEVFHTTQDELTFCEIASRTGGGRINATLEAAFGISFNKLLCEEAMGLGTARDLDLNAAPQRLAGFTMLCPTEGTFIAAEKTCPLPGVVSYQVLGHAGQSLKTRQFSGDNVASFVVIAETEEHVIERMKACASWFETTSIIAR